MDENAYKSKSLLICRKCISDKMSVPWGFATYRGFYNMYKIPEDKKCRECGSQLETTLLNCGEYDDINKISHDQKFILSMIELKETDIVEFNLKLSQFKTNIGQQESVKQEADNKVFCPKCKSTSITTGARGVNFTWGLFGASKTVNRCANCGYTWKPN